MRCKYCGNKSTGKFCSMSCQGVWEDMQTGKNKMTQFLKRVVNKVENGK